MTSLMCAGVLLMPVELPALLLPLPASVPAPLFFLLPLFPAVKAEAGHHQRTDAILDEPLNSGWLRAGCRLGMAAVCVWHASNGTDADMVSATGSASDKHSADDRLDCLWALSFKSSRATFHRSKYSLSSSPVPASRCCLLNRGITITIIIAPHAQLEQQSCSVSKHAKSLLHHLCQVA
jgi:hypothetical protein